MDSRAIAQDVVRELEEAWNAGDGAAFGAPFAADADFVAIRGDRHAGVPAIAGGHQAILDSIYRGSTVRYEVVGARELPGGVVLAQVDATLDAPAGPLAGTSRSAATLVLVPTETGHRITAFHNTLVTS